MPENNNPASQPIVLNNPVPQITQNIPKSPSDFKTKIKNNLGKIIFATLGLVILIELIIGGRVLLSPDQKPGAPTRIEALSKAKLVLEPSREKYKVGQVVPVRVKVVTGGYSTDSTDLVLKFDPNILEASTSGFIKVGKIYKEFPVTEVSQAQGTVLVSGITPPDGVGFVGVGNLATLYFQAKAEGKGKLSIDFKKGATSDSNIVKSGTSDDILEEVINTDVQIVSENASIQDANRTSNRCDGYVQYCLTSSGKTGRQKCLSGSYKGNVCQFDPILTVACEVCRTE